MTENPLARIPVITQAILDARPLDFHMGKLNELQVLSLMAGKMRANVELKNDITQGQLTIYRNAGLRFPGLFKRGGDGSNQHGKKDANRTVIRLADYGINSRIADICRKLAALPEQLFEDMILGVREKEHITHQEITVAYFYKAGKIEMARRGGISTDRPYTPATTITIDAVDMTAAARALRQALSAEQVNELIDELRKDATS